MRPFVVNDSTLVVPRNAVTLGPAHAAHVDLPLRGPVRRAAVTIGVRQYKHWFDPDRRFSHWVAPVSDAAPGLINDTAVSRRFPLKDGDQLQLGAVVLRVREAFPDSASPLFEFVDGTGAVRLKPNREFSRFVLFGDWLRVASESPCHIVLLGVSPDAIEISIRRESLVCRSLKSRSVFAETAQASGLCEWTGEVPYDVFVKPLELERDPLRRVARLSFREP